MTSTALMVFLIVVYAVVAVASLFERNAPRALYYLGAIIISIAVLWGTVKR